MEQFRFYADSQKEIFILQVLNETEYQAWAVQHKAAESDMNDREELVMQSCIALEKDLELLGRLPLNPLTYDMFIIFPI